MFFGEDCCLRNGAVEKRIILVFYFCLMRLHKKVGVEEVSSKNIFGQKAQDSHE